MEVKALLAWRGQLTIRARPDGHAVQGPLPLCHAVGRHAPVHARVQTTGTERSPAPPAAPRVPQELGQLREAQRAALRGVVEYDLTREPWMALARVSHALEDWPTLAWAAARALAITSVHPHSRFLTDAKSWGSEPHDLAALAAYYTGDYQRAWQQGLAAAQIEPNNERLRNNLDFYKRGTQGVASA